MAQIFWKLHPKIIRQLKWKGCSLPQWIRQLCWIFAPCEGVLYNHWVQALIQSIVWDGDEDGDGDLSWFIVKRALVTGLTAFYLLGSRTLNVFSSVDLHLHLASDFQLITDLEQNVGDSWAWSTNDIFKSLHKAEYHHKNVFRLTAEVFWDIVSNPDHGPFSCAHFEVEVFTSWWACQLGWWHGRDHTGNHQYYLWLSKHSQCSVHTAWRRTPSLSPC